MKKTPRSVSSALHYRLRVTGVGCLLWVATVAVVGAFWPFTATEENPFAGKLFVEERQEGQFTGFRTNGWDQGIMGDVFEFYSFTSPGTVTRGRGAFLVHDVSGNRNRYWFPVARLVDKSIDHPGAYVVEDSIKNQSYTVDSAKKLITFDSKETYVYEVSGKVISLKSDIKTKTLYEIETPFFLTDKTSIFWSGDQSVEPSFPEDFREEREAFAQLNDRIVEHHRNYFDNLITKAKGAPPVPLPAADPPLPPPPVTATVIATAEASALAVAPQPAPVADNADEENKQEPRRPTGEQLVDGQYKGSFVNELNETMREFELKIGSQGDLSGQPPSAAILATLRFDDGRGDDGLKGVATYGQSTTFTLGWKNSTGSMTFDGKLEGDQISGTWRLEGANEETGRGTFEATRNGL